MFKHPKVVPITAAKRESKEQLRTETIHAIPTGMVTAWQFARCSQLPAVKKRKYWRSRNTVHGSAAHEGRSFTCPGAAVTTAATPSHAFPVAAAEICKGTDRSFAAHGYPFCALEQSFSDPLSAPAIRWVAENKTLFSWAVKQHLSWSVKR